MRNIPNFLQKDVKKGMEGQKLASIIINANSILLILTAETSAYLSIVWSNMLDVVAFGSHCSVLSPGKPEPTEHGFAVMQKVDIQFTYKTEMIRHRAVRRKGIEIADLLINMGFNEVNLVNVSTINTSYETHELDSKFEDNVHAINENDC